MEARNEKNKNKTHSNNTLMLDYYFVSKAQANSLTTGLESDPEQVPSKSVLIVQAAVGLSQKTAIQRVGVPPRIGVVPSKQFIEVVQPPEYWQVPPQVSAVNTSTRELLVEAIWKTWIEALPAGQVNERPMPC